MKGRGGWWVAAGVAAMTSGVRADVPPSAFGRRVGTIAFDSSIAIDHEDFLRELPLRSGAPLTESGLADSVEWLHQKGIFSSVNAEARLEGGQVDVRFVVEPLDFVTDVEVRGEHAIDEADVTRRARLREDEPLSAERVRSATDRVRALYAARGYPDAVIEVGHEREAPGQIRVVIRVREGKPVRIERIEIAGVSDDADLARAALGFAEGDVFTRDRLAHGREALVRFFRQRSFYAVEVEGAAEITAGLAKLRFTIERGPRFEIGLVGNAALPTTKLLGLTDLGTRPIITDGTWRVLGQRMEQHYRDLGYAFAAVRVEIAGEDPRRVAFRINEGERVEVVQVRFHGVKALSRKELLAVMDSRPTSPWSLASEATPFREEVLAEDVERILQRYRRSGYLQAAVGQIGRDFRDGRRRITLIVNVTEGPRSIVEEVRVEGAERVLSDPLRALGLRRGEPFDPDRLEADRRTLLTQLAAQGYVHARVDPEVAEGGRDARGGRRVRVRFRVARGESTRIGRIIIQQNYVTHDRVIRRKLPFASGDPFDPAALLEAQREIYRLGIFRSVSIRPLQETGAVRDVAVQVGERAGGEVQYGFGYNSRAGLRNFLQIGHRNIMGTGRQLTLRGDLNLAPDNLVPDEYITSLEGREPFVWALPYDLRANVTYQRSERSIDEFSIRRFSFSSGFEREFRPGLQASILLEFEDSNIFDVAPDAVLTGKDVGRLRTVSLNPILVYDGRDDVFAPTRGVFETLRLRYGTPALGSDVHFFKVTAQHSHYVPLRSGIVFLYATRAGFAEPLGTSTTIPLRERFFLGGRTSVRGYEENGIGPRGERGNPIGGDLFFSANTELRFPILWGFSGAAFFDGGGLYLRERGISFDEFRESVGPGLRYQTPIGAVSLDFGVKLDRRRGESIGEWHFTIGNLF